MSGRLKVNIVNCYLRTEANITVMKGGGHKQRKREEIAARDAGG